VPAGRRQFGRVVEQRRAREDAPGEWQVMERGWCLGDQAFKEELLAQASEKRRDRHGPGLGRGMSYALTGWSGRS